MTAKGDIFADDGDSLDTAETGSYTRVRHIVNKCLKIVALIIWAFLHPQVEFNAKMDVASGRGSLSSKVHWLTF